MPTRAVMLLRYTALGAALSLAACQRTPGDDQVAALDNQITANQTDPALTSALEDPILTDPALSQQSNRNAVRPSGGPVQAQYPLGMSPGSGARQRPAGSAAVQPDSDRPASAARRELRQAAADGKACSENLDYNASWSRRLPASFPLLPGASVVEAAGNNSGDCRYRVVSFTSSHRPERVIEWYRQRAMNAGYSAEHQRYQTDQILAGASDRDGSAYYLIVTPRSGGSDIALIANNGV